MKLKAILMSGVAFSVAIPLNCAHAQQQSTEQSSRASATAIAPAATDAQSSETGQQDIVVTAQRRSESLQKVPIAITAFSQQQLTQKSISSGYDLTRAVPGLAATQAGGNPGQPSFSIRGRGQNYGAASGSVETYFGEVPLSTPSTAPIVPPQFFDLQSLQVLKGPQGTLFGRATTGGAVLLVPAAPTDKLEGYGRLQGGTYGDFQAEAAINIPLSGDKADLRIAGFYWRRDGYMHIGAGGIDGLTGKVLPEQTYGNHNELNLRASLLLRPVEGVENTTIVSYQWLKNRYSAGPYLELGFKGTGSTIACPAPGIFLFCGLSGAADSATAYTVNSPGKGTRFQPTTDVDLNVPASKFLTIINTTSVNLNDDLTLKNIFGYIKSIGYNGLGQDVDGTPGTLIDLHKSDRPQHNSQITEELQLQGKSLDGRFTWILGGLLDRTREPTGPTTINPQALTSGTTTFTAEQLTGYSAYASGTFAVTDQFKLTAGFRRTWTSIADLVVVNQPGYSTIVLPGSFLPLLKKKDKGNAWNLTADYQLTGNTLLYAGYRRGYKRAGFQPTAPTVALANFGQEKVDSFSLGLKTHTDIGGVPVRFNVEGYYDFYKNQQVSYITLQTDPFGIKSVTANVPKSIYRGFDMDIVADPAPWLTLSANYTLIDAFNKKWLDPTDTGPNPTNLGVNPIPYSPKNKASGTARFYGELPDGLGELAFAPSVNYQATFYTSPFGAKLPLAYQLIGGDISQIALGGVTVPGYVTADLRVELNHIKGSNISIAVNVINLTNKLFYEGNNGNLAFGTQGEDYGAPRMISFEVSAKF